jgi:hypothetical protein
MTLLLRILLRITASVGLASCTSARESRAESDYSHSGSFRRYWHHNFMESHSLSSDTSCLSQVLRQAARAIFNHLRIQATRYLLAPNASGAGDH